MASALRRFYKRSPRLRRLSRRVKNGFIGGVGSAALWLVGRLSLEGALRFGTWCGAAVFHLLPGARRLALENLRLAFGDQLDDAARERIARGCFVSIARCFCELAVIDEIRRRQAEYFELEGWEVAEEVLGKGGGAVAVTGHIANWELLAAYFAWRGLKVAAVARRIYAEGLNDLLVDFRKRQGVETILRESPSSARQILRALKSNAVLAMLIDQDTHVASVSVPFFGRPARTPVAPAALAVRRDLPVVPIFLERRGDWGYRVVIRPPVQVEPSGDESRDVYALTARLSACLEDQIRAHPQEWVWWHRRWRRGPVERLDPDFHLSYTNVQVFGGQTGPISGEVDEHGS